MDINLIAFSAVSFVIGALVGPLFKGKGEAQGKLIRTKMDDVVDHISDPEFKLAMTGFMGRINETMADKSNYEKFLVAVDFALASIYNAIPGPLDDIALKSIVKPAIQGLYEGYIKTSK